MERRLQPSTTSDPGCNVLPGTINDRTSACVQHGIQNRTCPEWNTIRVINSSDKDVKKIIFTGAKHPAVAEAVLYKYPTYTDRTVICCSTQSGCPVGCRFCGAGNYFVRNLTADEIVAQPKYLVEMTGISAEDMNKFQIMVMSMGEPLLNFGELEKAFDRLYEMYPNARLLISSIGPNAVDYDKVFAMAERIPTVGLQFSVHESTDEARNKLIPLKGKKTLTEIGKLGEDFLTRTGRQPFFNYCAHGSNTSAEDVERLSALFNPSVWQSTISVICESEESISAANERQRKLADDFMQKMLQAGYGTRMFDPAGQDDVGGGCGQLWHVQKWMRENPDFAKKSIGHGKPVVHTPTL